MFDLPPRHLAPGAVEHHEARTRRPLVERADVSLHIRPFCQAPDSPAAGCPQRRRHRQMAASESDQRHTAESTVMGLRSMIALFHGSISLVQRLAPVLVSCGTDRTKT